MARTVAQLNVVPNARPAAPSEPNFFPPEEEALIQRFLQDGYVIVPVENRVALDRLRLTVAESAAKWLGVETPADPGTFLDTIHTRAPYDRINEMRLAVINGLNTQPWVSRAYFSLARRTVETLVGNELAMQRRLNLSVQMPNDETSVLPVHADVWDGDSPFEVVQWTPLVDCKGTKAMFLLPPKADARHAAEFRRFDGKSVEDLFRAIEPDVIWPEVKYGETMVFSLNLMHGNRVNFEPGTRWSFNCRLKGLFSPYADKRLGEFFEPITVRPASRFGLNYAYLEGFDE